MQQNNIQGHLSIEEQKILESLTNPEDEVKNNYKLTEEMQRRILGYLFNPQLMTKAAPFVKPGYFTFDAHKMIARLVIGFFEKYKICPDRLVAIEMLAAALADRNEKIQEHYRQELVYVLDHHTAPVESFEHSLGELKKFDRINAFRELFSGNLDTIKKTGDIDFVSIREEVAKLEKLYISEDQGLRLLNRDELDKIELPEFLVAEHVAKGELTIINGKEGSCKTFLALDLALSMATGKADFMGYQVSKQAKVCYLLSEGQRSFYAKRIKAWESFYGVKFDSEWFRPIYASVDLAGAGVAQLRAAFEQSGFTPEVIVVDTFGLNIDCSESDQELVNKAVRQSIELANDGFAVIILTHPPKNNPSGDPLGNSFLIRHAARCIQLDKTDECDTIAVYQKKNKDGGKIKPYLVDPVVVDLGDGISSIVLTMGKTKAVTLQEKLLALIEDNGGALDSTIAATKLNCNSGRTRQELSNLVDGLSLTGQIIKIDNPDDKRKVIYKLPKSRNE